MTISAQRSFESSEALATAPGQLRVIKRNGTLVSYDASKIAFAISKAFLAVEVGSGPCAGACGPAFELHASVSESGGLSDQL